MNKTVNDTREFAIKAHGNQKYGDKPYVYHLDAVAKILEPYGEEAQIIGYLHDVAEDTEISLQEIEDEFGLFISMCCYIVTDPIGNRHDRKERLNHKLSIVGNVHSVSLIVKAADRLANLERGEKIDMYKKEHSKFKDAAYRLGLCDDLWKRMELIFKQY